MIESQLGQTIFLRSTVTKVKMLPELHVRYLQIKLMLQVQWNGAACVKQKSHLSCYYRESNSLLLSPGKVLLNVLTDEFSMLNDDMDH